MMITNISSSSQVRNVYAYGNSHYNQIQSTAVSPVVGIQPIVRTDGEEDEIKFGVTYLQDKKAVSDELIALKEKESLAESYKNENTVSYDVSNPYEAARRTMESSLLLGMNFDMLV